MEVIATKTFIKSAKSISKKYRSFNADYQQLVKALTDNPRQGVDLGNGYRKVRMAIASKGRGKSGGCRVITFGMLEKDNRLYLLYIYDKADCSNVELSVIRALNIESMGIRGDAAEPEGAEGGPGDEG